MRILGFSKKWDKLNYNEFTTFRFPRKDKDWQIGEVVQIVYKPRSRERGVLGIAEIMNKEPRRIDRYRGVSTIPYPGFITEIEAQEDGFVNGKEMLAWLETAHHRDGRWLSGEPMNKLSLKWINSREVNNEQ